MKHLLEVRAEMKAKKPRFLRQDAHKKNKLANNWRAPRGIHSKMRKKLRGYRRQPSIGFSSPKKVRGLSYQGLKQTIVHNAKELEAVKGACILSSTIGNKNKITLLKKAKEKKIRILNVKDSDVLIKKIEETLKKRKEQLKSKEMKKKKAKEISLEKAKKKEEKEKTEEQKEQKEKARKEEKRKILEQK